MNPDFEKILMQRAEFSLFSCSLGKPPFERVPAKNPDCENISEFSFDMLMKKLKEK